MFNFEFPELGGGTKILILLFGQKEQIRDMMDSEPCARHAYRVYMIGVNICSYQSSLLQKRLSLGRALVKYRNNCSNTKGEKAGKVSFLAPHRSNTPYTIVPDKSFVLTRAQFSRISDTLRAQPFVKRFVIGTRSRNFLRHRHTKKAWDLRPSFLWYLDPLSCACQKKREEIHNNKTNITLERTFH